MPEPPMMPSTALVMGRSDVLLRVAGVLDRRPYLLLGEVEKAGQNDEEDHYLEADALARLQMRLGDPHQEGGDVLGVLVDLGGRLVGILDEPVGKRWGHGRGVAGA